MSLVSDSSLKDFDPSNILNYKEEKLMQYVAIHYVKIAGRMYTPGEIFTAELPAEKEQRLITKGAIRAMPGEVKEPEIPIESGITQSTSEDDDYGEADETEDEAPEIDVMDGIVDDDEPAAEKAKPKTRRRKAAPKKPAAQGGTDA